LREKKRRITRLRFKSVLAQRQTHRHIRFYAVPIKKEARFGASFFILQA